MSSSSPPIDPRELEAAFSLFNEASRQLSSAYSELQEQVVSLKDQLEIANGALRRELEEKAALSRRLGLLLARLPAGVVELDSAGVVIQMNPAAEQLLGAEVIGKSWDEFKTEYFHVTPESGLWKYQSHEGERRFSLVESDIPEEDIRLLLIHDLTESWALQQALSRHQRLVAMGEMSAGLAHQLRTPLATALLYVGHLSRPTLGEPERLRFAGKALIRLRDLETLIGNMLRFVRGQTHEIEVVLLADLLEEAAQTLAPQFDEAGIRLHVQMEDQTLAARVNHKEMVGALANLLDNALYASSSGGMVELTLRRQREDAIIEVRDHGCGMTEEVLARLFDPFFTTRKEGTGLGLAIVRNLVTMYGGEISAESTPHLGSLLQIRLPLVAVQSRV